MERARGVSTGKVRQGQHPAFPGHPGGPGPISFSALLGAVRVPVQAGGPVRGERVLEEGEMEGRQGWELSLPQFLPV